MFTKNQYIRGGGGGGGGGGRLCKKGGVGQFTGLMQL